MAFGAFALTKRINKLTYSLEKKISFWFFWLGSEMHGTLFVYRSSINTFFFFIDISYSLPDQNRNPFHPPIWSYCSAGGTNALVSVRKRKNAYWKTVMFRCAKPITTVTVPRDSANRRCLNDNLNAGLLTTRRCPFGELVKISKTNFQAENALVTSTNKTSFRVFRSKPGGVWVLPVRADSARLPPKRWYIRTPNGVTIVA